MPQSGNNNELARQHGGSCTTLLAKCLFQKSQNTSICKGSPDGPSCTKIVLVGIYNEDRPDDEVHHQGCLITLGALQNAGYWLVGGHGAVASLISSCVTCKKLPGPMLDQQMADLPLDRSEVGLPFTNVGIDVFEPWAVQTRRTIGGAAKLKALGSSIPVHGQ